MQFSFFAYSLAYVSGWVVFILYFLEVCSPTYRTFSGDLYFLGRLFKKLILSINGLPNRKNMLVHNALLTYAVDKSICVYMEKKKNSYSLD